MPDYNNEPGGLLFIERTPKTDRHPFITGTLRLEDGSSIKVSGWWVTDTDGRKRTTSNGSYMVSTKVERDGANAAPTKPKPSQDDDLPF